MAARAVLHVTSVPGGGVDRHIRDIARSSGHRHLIWHAAEGGDAIEIPSEKRIVPLGAAAMEREADTLAAFLREQGVGIVHGHAVTEAPRQRADWASRALGIPKVITLHDVLFLRREAFDRGGPPERDEDWLARTQPFIRDAAAVIAPSEWLARVARENIPGVEVSVIPNGSGVRFNGNAVPVHPAWRGREFPHVAIVLGAVGPHKGSRLLEQAAERLAGSDIGIVVIGYMDESNLPSWHRDHLFVHGSYQDADVASLVRAYGGRVALFTNQVPESFSYALSDVWAAGLPAIVPAAGALGDRMRAHGGGWILPEPFDGADVAALLERLFSSEGSAELARVESQLHEDIDERVPPLAAMTRSLDALYERFGIHPNAPIDATAAQVQRLLATSLDGSLFRSEMVRFAGEIEQLNEALAHERTTHARSVDEMKGWIAKLEADVAALQSQLAVESRNLAAVQAELFEQRNETQRHRDAAEAWHAQLRAIPRAVRWLFRRKPRDARR